MTDEAGELGIVDGADPIRVALRFIADIRDDPALHEKIVAAATAEAGLDGILEVAARSGYVISAEDLRAAFAMDWGLRRAFYLRGPSS